jgi:Bardet-Biedl syndrome 2 protein
VLFVGTQSNLTAYDVERNAEIFFREVPDGVNTLQFGRMHDGSSPLIIVGGNCSVYGFDKDGAEKFWTVTGDNVSSLALVPRPDALVVGTKELLVGSDDFEVRVFHNEELTSEITEADKVTLLCPMNGPSFAYGLTNGTIGLYNEARQRVWRVKAKHAVTALQAYDLDCDGAKEVVSGWSNGAVNVRRAGTGEIIFKDSMKSPIAGIVVSDYRMDGKDLLMICSESGEVRAYLATDVDLQAAANASGAGVAAVSGEQRILSELQAQKQDLIAQLRMLEKSLKNAKTGEMGVGALPANTTMNHTLSADAASGLIYIRVESSTDVHMHTIIAFDTGMGTHLLSYTHHPY